jgi:hypothetical protein
MHTRRDIHEELRISRKIVARGVEVTPRLVVYSPTGNHTLVLPLSDDEGERRAHFRLARLFMVWKAATGFILSTELKMPDAITSTLVTRDEVIGASQLISRDPPRFAELVWFGRENVAAEIIDLLPAKSVYLTADEVLIIEEFENGALPELTWFKPGDADD